MARGLARGGAVAARLKQYEALRRAGTAGVRRDSRRNARVFHLRGLKAGLRNVAARQAPHRLFGYNALQAHRQ